MQFIQLDRQQARIKTALDANMQAVLAHGHYIMGPEIKILEQQLAHYVGVKHCVALANGTDALLLAMRVLGVQAGDEVITTPFTFISTGEMIVALGAIPVFVDIDPDTYLIDPAAIEAAITPKTKAILPVSLFGQCADLTAINKIAQRHGLAVIEDAAQSFGATHHGKQSGSMSAISCTSFFPSKPLGCYGDGGACLTDDDEIATSLRILRNHGQTHRYNHTMIGINSRLDTLQAAILLAKMSIFPDELNERAQVASRYTSALMSMPHVRKMPSVQPGNTHVYAQYTIEVDNRDDVADVLQTAGIPIAVHYPTPLHLQPAFAYLGQGVGSFPIAEAVSKCVLSLPMDGYLLPEEQQQIMTALALSFQKECVTA